MSTKKVIKRELSWVRVACAVVVVSGLAYSTTLSFERWQDNGFELVSRFEPWYASYVDVTSVPYYPFEQRGGDVASDAVLSFIVSSNEDPCVPTWGGYYTLDEAAMVMDLDRRIARFQQQEGKIAVSFGGALNSEPALKCTDEDELFEAYKAVVERYNINTIDLDLERESLASAEAGERRARVIKRLQEYYRINERDLAVWLTLPVAPFGMTKEGTDAVAVMLKHGVDLAGVNVMTMEYGSSKDENDSMYEATRKALNETHRQLSVLYELADINLSSVTIWEKIGVTPMIGQNGFKEEVFTIEDAEALNQFALSKGVGRMSMWSANRDIPCGENYVDTSVVSDLCSGVTTPQYKFGEVLARGFTGDLMQNAQMITVEDATSTDEMVDDPETSPYQIWQESGTYLKGTKVVWKGNVYEAKWWTKNDLPNNPVLQAWETPWLLLGPVLETDVPIRLPSLPEGTYREWSGTAIYNGGDRVMFEGKPYYAKWWNQGSSPAAATSNPDSTPWVPLRQDEIELILEAMGL